MKKNLIFVFIGTLLAFAACEPIEKRHEMEPAKSATEAESDITITVNGNRVSCVNNDETVITYWTSAFGDQANGPVADFYIPVKGTFDITAKIYGGDKEVVVVKQAIIANDDTEYFSHAFWNLLTNGTAGKTWVWADDIPGGAVWGNGGYIGNVSPGWWTNTLASITTDKGASIGDEIILDLDNGINITVNMPGSGLPGSGNGAFRMNVSDEDQILDGDGNVWSWGKINFINQTIPLGFQPNFNDQLQYEFDILKLTDDELVLACPEPGVTSAWGTAWFWMFKRKGYTYK